MNRAGLLPRAAALLGLGALLFGCASREPQRDSSGLVKVVSRKPGNLFVHPSRSIDDYDDVWISEVGIAYAPKQPPMSEEDAKAVGKMVHDLASEKFPVVGQLAVPGPGPCTLTLGVHLVALEFPHAGAHNNGSGTIVLEFQDAQTGDPLVRYGQRRELGTRTASKKIGPDLERIEQTVESVLEDVGQRLRDVPVKQTGALAGRGCSGKIGAVRRQARTS
ncbi:MAG TPA: hypothetical protein VKH41_16075 [Myxococcota bacterium]|nr:hypothetical protein [Myxococcota bacterium]